MEDCFLYELVDAGVADGRVLGEGIVSPAVADDIKEFGCLGYFCGCGEGADGRFG